ncbi:MAG: L,D-transpeptidase family protein [Candidatus Kaiserbacteria bacterium]|nr:L,D-transpeptidase family protein [Candidatus Kaiserbacteria bacterium]MCB9816786.1 L,D-transpeptidase family protein [Candidatus Nomurabacteria bacterium]
MPLSERQANRTIFILSVLVLFLLAVLFKVGGFWGSSQTDTNSSTSPIVYLDDFAAPDSPFLGSEEVVVIEATSTDAAPVLLPIERVLFEYVEVLDSCGPHFEGECLRVRSGPGPEYPVVASVRNGVVLKVGGMVEHASSTWYKIVFDEWLRYPERLQGDWYISADYVKVLLDEGDKTIWEHDYSTSTQKVITVDRSEQKLYAFEGSELFMEANISTGLELTPTPRGTFTIYKKTPSRYMQGPLPNLIDQQVYDLPGVPWNLYFTEGGAVIHGAYWHNSFGSQYSHGCVNLPPDTAHTLYNWAELGTTVIVKD